MISESLKTDTAVSHPFSLFSTLWFQCSAARNLRWRRWQAWQQQGFCLSLADDAEVLPSCAMISESLEMDITTAVSHPFSMLFPTPWVSISFSLLARCQSCHQTVLLFSDVIPSVVSCFNLRVSKELFKRRVTEIRLGAEIAEHPDFE